jgi:hypothetical protein
MRIAPDHDGVHRPATRLAFLVIAVVTAAACTGANGRSGTASNPSASPSAWTLPERSAPTNTTWLCRPGLAANPCAVDLGNTEVEADGSTRIEPGRPASDPPIDCFYVYPTVSKQKGVNATLKIDPEERAVAVAQAARFSQVCNVYAPVYPQLTMTAINKPDKISLVGALNAYEGVWLGFLDYMAHYNHGRGVVFIGHSQGAFMLTMLIKAEIDTQPARLHQLVSAFLMGGNVTVPIGKTVGGDFDNIPACDSAAQTGCVVAYSSFATTPPENAYFGRVDSPINPFGGGEPGALQVLCVNPASPGGGSGGLSPYLPTQGVSALLGASAGKTVTAKTMFVSYPYEFTAHCQTAGQTTWLQIDRRTVNTDRRPGLSKVGSLRWGLHTIDVNIALGNLVELVRKESAAYKG